jgi:uncharacterized protein YjdB
MKKHISLLASPITALILTAVATSCGSSDTPTKPDAPVVKVQSVSLNETTLPLEVGHIGQLTATVEPNNATNQEVAWTSSNDDVATVDQTGRVFGIDRGEAIITVTTRDGNKTADCSVAVKVDVTGVYLNKTILHLDTGVFFWITEKLIATVKPDNASQEVEWASSNEAVATVDPEGNVQAITTITNGEAIITVTTKDGGKTATCKVLVFHSVT